MNFNEIQVPDVVESSPVTDLGPENLAQESLSRYRDIQSGLVGVTIVIRPYDDDYASAFADPTYYFQKELSIQVGIGN